MLKDTHRHALAIGLRDIHPSFQSFVHSNVYFNRLLKKFSLEPEKSQLEVGY